MESINKIRVYLTSNNAFCNAIEFSAQYGDIKSRKIEAEIYKTFKTCKNGTPYDCTGKIINIVYEYMNENGIIETSPEYLCDVNHNNVVFTIPNKPLMNTGVVTAQIKIYDSDKSSLLNSALFKFEVLRSIAIGSESNVNDDVPILIKLIKDVKDLDKSLTEHENDRIQSEIVREKKFNEKFKEISDAKDNLNNVISNAEKATLDAINAANLVPNNILKDANKATKNANVAADRANNAAEKIENASLNIDLSEYAKIDSQEFKGIPTSPTPTESSPYNQIATKGYVDKQNQDFTNLILEEKISAIKSEINDSLLPRIDSKIDKIEDKGLSTNDYKTEDMLYVQSAQQGSPIFQNIQIAPSEWEMEEVSGNVSYYADVDITSPRKKTIIFIDNDVSDTDLIKYAKIKVKGFSYIYDPPKIRFETNKVPDTVLYFKAICFGKDEHRNNEVHFVGGGNVAIKDDNEDNYISYHQFVLSDGYYDTNDLWIAQIAMKKNVGFILWTEESKFVYKVEKSNGHIRLYCNYNPNGKIINAIKIKRSDMLVFVGKTKKDNSVIYTNLKNKDILLLNGQQGAKVTLYENRADARPSGTSRKFIATEKRYDLSKCKSISVYGKSLESYSDSKYSTYFGVFKEEIFIDDAYKNLGGNTYEYFIASMRLDSIGNNDHITLDVSNVNGSYRIGIYGIGVFDTYKFEFIPKES